jgi:hypothetical protein
MSNTPHKDALTAEQILRKKMNKVAFNAYNNLDQVWRKAILAAMEEYAALQQSKGNDLEPGPLQTL